MDRLYKSINRFAILVTLCLIVLGAYVRLSDAGLGCPDWPVCYGKLTWPNELHETQAANQAFPERPVEIDKAWKEQVHRHLASILGFMVLAMAWIANRKQGWHLLSIGASVVSAVAGIVLYVKGEVMIAANLSIFALAVLLLASLFWRSNFRSRFSVFLLAVVMFQAMLGMWTVTLLVQPIIVTAHLLGGMTTLGLVVWGAMADSPSIHWRGPKLLSSRVKQLGLLASAVLVVQIFLGGWVSTNYSALACYGFPACSGEWLPQTNFQEGFTLWRELNEHQTDFEGGVISHAAAVAIQLAHRLGAVIAFVVLMLFAHLLMFRSSGFIKQVAISTIVVLLLQIVLGIGNVFMSLPLWMAVAHNAGAALLVLTMTILMYAVFKGVQPIRRQRRNRYKRR